MSLISISKVPATSTIPTGNPHPFIFPYPSSPDRLEQARPLGSFDVTDTISAHILTVPIDTSGIVRNISLVVSTNDLRKVYFNVAYDGETTPSISVPLGTLFGMEYPSLASDALRVITPAFEITATPSPAGPYGAGWAFSFKLPIPYGNGIDIYISASAGGSAGIWSNVIYQNHLRNWWNSNIRLLGIRSDELVPAPTTLNKQLRLTSSTNLQCATDAFVPSDEGKSLGGTIDDFGSDDCYVTAYIDARNVRIDPKDAYGFPLNTYGLWEQRSSLHTFISLPSGTSGWIAMITGGIQGVGVTYEGNPRFFLDQESTAAFEWTSQEDFANGAFYFGQPPTASGTQGGQTCKDTTHGSIYKVFWDFPINFSDGIIGKVAQVEVQATYNWTTLYYKVM